MALVEGKGRGELAVGSGRIKRLGDIEHEGAVIAVENDRSGVQEVAGFTISSSKGFITLCRICFLFYSYQNVAKTFNFAVDKYHF